MLSSWPQIDGSFSDRAETWIVEGRLVIFLGKAGSRLGLVVVLVQQSCRKEGYVSG